MNHSAKEALLAITIAVCVFLLLRPKKELEENNKKVSSTGKKIYDMPIMTEEDKAKYPEAADAYMLLTAYIEAYNTDVSQDVLDEINAEASAKFGLKAIPMADGTLSVQDSNGKEVMFAD